MSLREIRAVYVQELRNLLRDRHILIYSVALPAFLYPAVVIGVVEVIKYVAGIEEARESRVELVDRSGSGRIDQILGEGDRRIRSEVASGSTVEVTVDTEGAPSRLVSLYPEAPTHALVVVDRGDVPDSIDATIFYNGASDASVKASERVVSALEDYRHSVLVDYAKELGEDESFLTSLEIEDESLSSQKEIANHILALVLPMVMIFMTALGAFYPALDVTVGEKERGTLETTLLSPIARFAVVAGKYGAVTTLSLLSFSLNFAGMYLTFAQISASNHMAVADIGIGAIALIAVGAVLLAGFFSAAMMLIAFLARSFKEGQGYVTPIYLISLAPFAVLANPDVHQSLPLSFVPVVNVALLFRDALGGRADASCVVVTLLTSTALAMLALRLASGVLSREDVATGGEVRFSDILRRLFVAGREESST